MFHPVHTQIERRGEMEQEGGERDHVQRSRQTHRQTNWWIDRQMEKLDCQRQGGRQAGKQTYLQTDRRTDRETGRETDRQTGRLHF